jgi:uncharacterized membrane protein
MSLPGNTGTSGRARYLLMGSLTLNLLLAGAVGAVALQHSSAAPLQPVVGIKHGMVDHLDRVAASLPANDAELMRTQLLADARKLAAAETEVRLSQEAVRDRLRAEPFDPAALRAAMAQTGAAREQFYQILHDALAAVMAKMSDAGRKRLADWPIRRANGVVTQ